MFMNSRTAPSLQLVGPTLLPYKSPLPTTQTSRHLLNILGMQQWTGKRPHLHGVSACPKPALLSCSMLPLGCSLPGGHHGSSQCSSTQKPFLDGHMLMEVSLETLLSNKSSPFLKLPVSPSDGEKCMHEHHQLLKMRLFLPYPELQCQGFTSEDFIISLLYHSHSHAEANSKNPPTLPDALRG